MDEGKGVKCLGYKRNCDRKEGNLNLRLLLNFVDWLQKSMVRLPATLNIVGPPLKEITGMSKSFRVSIVSTGVVVMLLGLAQIAAAQLIISEFRVRGPNGANDEFIEIYNNSGADHTVAGGGTGYGVAASNGVARCVIPNGTVIPNRGHYLCVNSVGYSLASYPAGNGTTATGDATYTTDIPDNAGIAIFNTSVAADFVLANRLDAVGSTSEANTLYKEGTGYPALTPFSIDYSFYRDNCGKGGSITTFGACHNVDTPQRYQQQRRGLHLRRYQRHVCGRGPASRRTRTGEPEFTDPA